MNQQKATFGELIDIVERRRWNNFDEVVLLKEIEFQDLSTVKISGEVYEVLPSAQRLIANKLRIPLSYLNRCPLYLQRENLAYWQEQERRKRDTFFCRFTSNGNLKLRAIFTERYVPNDNLEVLQKLKVLGFKSNQEVHFTLDDEILVVKFPNYDDEFRVARNDVIVPGVSVANSEVGLLSLSIETYFYRLACSNGLISLVSAGKSKFKHISRKGLENLPEIIAGILGGLSVLSAIICAGGMGLAIILFTRVISLPSLQVFSSQLFWDIHNSNLRVYHSF